MPKYSKADQDHARERLLEWLKPGDVLYTKVTHVARSGMSRSIEVLHMENNEPHNITWAVARILEESIDQTNGGIKVSGCGMDMGFDTVYRLGYALWPDGFDCTGKGCNSNDHTNRVDQAHHTDGGYALKQRSL